MSEIILRPYQEKFIDDIREQFRAGVKNVCGVAPCGAGKTIMTGYMIRESELRGKRSVFFVHRKELIEQTSKTFYELGIPHGIISADAKMQLHYPVQIASVQTLTRRLDKIPVPDFMVCDECHHILAESYRKILSAWNKSLLLGVTATPQRMGGVNLGDVFQSMVFAPSVTDLIKLGNLTNFDYYAPGNDLNFSGLHTRYGEFVNSEISSLMSGNKIVGDIVETYKKIAPGKSAICYCVNIAHSEKISAAFNSAGIPAAHCDGCTDKNIRAAIVEDFRLGKIKVLCNAELFGEGFDVPNMQAVILARPTKSLTLFIQQAMRPLRPDPNEPDKRAIIIDHVENYKRHGLPDDDREWSLQPKPEKEIKREIKFKKCPDCGLLVSNVTTKCPACGYEFSTAEKSKRELNEVGGELKKVHGSEESKTSENKKRPSATINFILFVDELMEVAAQKEYKKSWVAFQALKYAKSFEDCLCIAKAMNYKDGWAWHQWRELSEKKGIEKAPVLW